MMKLKRTLYFNQSFLDLYHCLNFRFEIHEHYEYDYGNLFVATEIPGLLLFYRFGVFNIYNEQHIHDMIPNTLKIVNYGLIVQMTADRLDWCGGKGLSTAFYLYMFKCTISQILSNNSSPQIAFSIFNTCTLCCHFL